MSLSKHNAAGSILHRKLLRVLPSSSTIMSKFVPNLTFTLKSSSYNQSRRSWQFPLRVQTRTELYWLVPMQNEDIWPLSTHHLRHHLLTQSGQPSEKVQVTKNVPPPTRFFLPGNETKIKSERWPCPHEVSRASLWHSTAASGVQRSQDRVKHLILLGRMWASCFI